MCGLLNCLKYTFATIAFILKLFTSYLEHNGQRAQNVPDEDCSKYRHGQGFCKFTHAYDYLQ